MNKLVKLPPFLNQGITVVNLDLKPLSIIVFIILSFSAFSFAQQGTPIYYTVQPSEGLYRVAIKNNASMEDIRQWNGLKSDNLSVGQKLIVGFKKDEETSYKEEPVNQENIVNTSKQPKYYTVLPGEGLYRVAVKNNVTMAEIRKWNELMSDNISPGQRLIVGYDTPTLQEDEQLKTQALYEETIASGNNAYGEEDYDEAKKYFEKALSINPNSYIAKKRLSDIEAIKIKQIDEQPVQDEQSGQKANEEQETDIDVSEEVPPPLDTISIENDNFNYNDWGISIANLYPESNYYYPSRYSPDYTYPGFQENPVEFNYPSINRNYPGDYYEGGLNYYP